MACLDMYNSEHKSHHHHHHQHHHHHCPPISPRISFSNDFVDSHSQQASIIKQERSSRDAPVSSDFEFSVSNYSMMSGADELFFKGRILPFKDTQIQRPTTTLREELLAVDDDDEGFQDFSLRPPKGSSTSWKGFLGLRKSHIGSKKAETSSDKGVETGGRRSRLVNEGARVNMTSQCFFQEGGSGCRDVEIGI
ncbi:uncharacterized protein G2W53_036566 [Senna tora]|uniref:Uncharacterized protein n=1 Tax=Senna tora TaxID=362788 RepID=A0A834W666_9FABA|nr:uncharacterized protein G2W53_036566 [Senna tora]